MMKNIDKYYGLLLLCAFLYSCAGKHRTVLENAMKENLEFQQQLLNMEYGHSYLILPAEEKEQAAEIQQHFLKMSDAEIKGMDYVLAEKTFIHKLDLMYMEKYRESAYSDTLFPAPNEVSFADRLLRLHLFFERALPLVRFNGCHFIPKADIERRLIKIGRYKNLDKYALIYYEPSPYPAARIHIDAGTVYECRADSGTTGLVTFRIPKVQYLSHISWMEGGTTETERSFEWPGPFETRYKLLPAQ
ncbi:MAG: hypothetical protein IBJ09_10680 [Bacteroidia bacterium]|nr:hypothetical protein [Bacteroidia bacterium]